MTDSTNGGLTVHAQSVDWLGEAHKSGPVVSADPTAADVLASIDAVGVGHIGEAASVRAAAASGCNWRSWGGTPDRGHHVRRDSRRRIPAGTEK